MRKRDDPQGNPSQCPSAVVLMELYLSGEIAHVFALVAKHGVLAQMDLHSQTSQDGQLSRPDEIMEGLSDEVNLGRHQDVHEKAAGEY